MKLFSRLFPVVILAIFVAYLGMKMKPVSDQPGEMALHRFGKLPVVEQGRVKPLDTLARNALYGISDRQAFYDEGETKITDAEKEGRKSGDVKGDKQPAVKWLLGVFSRAEDAFDWKIIRIDNLQLTSSLGLEVREGPSSKKFRYSINEVGANFSKIEKNVISAFRLEPDLRDTYQKQLVKLGSRMMSLNELLSLDVPHIAPPRSENEQWRTLGEVMTQSQATGQVDLATDHFMSLLKAYSQKDVKQFNQLVDAQTQLATERLGQAVMNKVAFEAYYNHFSPLYHGIVIYVFAFVLCCLAWLGWAGPLNRSALGLIVLALILQTVAISARIYISGKPPVTNLYTVAVCVGWGCVLIGLILERIYRGGVGLAVGSLIGFITLIIAHQEAAKGDTFRVLRAVLDTPFWLTTHVIIITLGYSATILAGFLGILYVFRGVLTKSLRKSADADMNRMIYGTICFGLFFSFIGTVLGGLWGDDSWGRFWGWDVKENGALIIVLWNALILHARWSGMIRNRGLAVMAVFGNIVTAWAWYGVNQLEVGLHSYGFTDSIAYWLILFVMSQWLIMMVGLLPLDWWRSMHQSKPLPDIPDIPVTTDP